MSDLWSERAQLYVESEAHRAGEDLDLLVEWAGEACVSETQAPSGPCTALDVATGGGHVARRLREAGLEVVTSDPARGMGPDVIAPAEDLPFADSSFDVVTCRVAAHHFEDVSAAVAEMARVARDRVLVVDNVFLSDAAEEAERLRDPSHVRNYTEAQWRAFLVGAGLRVEEVRRFDKVIELEPWLERTGCVDEEAARVRELLADRIDAGFLHLDRIALLGRV